LVGARLPPVELRRRPESVVGPPLGPAEARGVGAALLRLLLVVVAAAARRAAAAYLTPPRPIEELPNMAVASAARIYARRGLSVRRRRAIAAAGGNLGGDCGEGEIRSRPASAPSTAIYRGRCGPDVGACIADGGRRADVVSIPCEKRPPTRKSARAVRCGPVCGVC
jgi:hypothetical protein